jgi:hypothetical protein
MLYLNLMGGLGNQLFQIFALINLSFELKIPFKLPVNKNDIVSPLDKQSKRPTYWNNIFKILQRFVIQFEEPYVLIKENHNSTFYDLSELPLQNNKNYKLNGYFQSEKYFVKNYENIKRLIGIDKLREFTKENYKDLLEDQPISLHFRIGDYIKNPECHPILPSEYYINAINKIKEIDNINKIIYFFEKKDIEIINKNINNLKNIFTNIEFIPCPDNLEDWQELLLMSCCKNHIIANSTFSWWGAYFNDDSNKIVCYPSLWFGDAIKKKTNDLFPKSWIVI